MKYAAQLSLEVVAVALVTALALALAVKISGPIASAPKALVVGLVVGALIHLGFELAGGNAAYCRVGAACAKL